MQALVYPYKFKNQKLYKMPRKVNLHKTDVQKKNPVDRASTGFVAPRVGLEPTTLRLTAACSTD